MKYDFTTVIDRHGKDAIAVDLVGRGSISAPKEGFDAIPMWVADMNFPTAPTIQEEIIKRARHPMFGYFEPTDEYYDSIIRWQREHNQVEGLTKEHIGYENGVLGGVMTALSIFCSKGDNVLLNSPTYIGFTGSLENSGYHIVLSDLIKDENEVWRMDYDDMEKKIVENHIHVAIVCSPYNPVGRVWEKEELAKAMEVFERHGVYVISDEIWSDILINGAKHVPTQSVSDYAREHTVALYAPTKTFNLAGFHMSYHIVYNPWIRQRMEKEASESHYNSLNVLSMHALIGAYKPEGVQWVEELKEVLSQNVNYAYDYIRSHFKGVWLAKPEGTYMLFLDCQKWCEQHGCDVEKLLHAGWDVGVVWQDGRPFHGAYCIRMNLASPFSRIKEAFERLDKYVFNAQE